MNIGDNIKKYRKQNKMTQTELANKLNKSLRTIQKYESNDVTPSLKILRQISDIFKIYIEDLTNTNDDVDIYEDLVAEYVDQYISRMSINDILTLKNQQLYENELENKEYLYDKLDPKQLELLYLSKINDLESIIKSQSKEIQTHSFLNNRQSQLLELLLDGKDIDDILDKRAEERMFSILNLEYKDNKTLIDAIINHKAEARAKELFKNQAKINKLLGGGTDGE